MDPKGLKLDQKELRIELLDQKDPVILVKLVPGSRFHWDKISGNEGVADFGGTIPPTFADQFRKVAFDRLHRDV